MHCSQHHLQVDGLFFKWSFFFDIRVARLKLEAECSVDILLAFFDGTLETPPKRHRPTATKKKPSIDSELPFSDFLTVAKVDLKLVSRISLCNSRLTSHHIGLC